MHAQWGFQNAGPQAYTSSRKLMTPSRQDSPHLGGVHTCVRNGSRGKDDPRLWWNKQSTVRARQSQELSSKHPRACLGLQRHAATNAEEAGRGGISEESRSREGRDGRGRHIAARSGRRLPSGTDPTESGARRGARHAHSSSLPQTRSHQPGKTWLPRSRTPRERAEEVLCACLAG